MNQSQILTLARDLVEARKTMIPVARVADLNKSDADLVKKEVMRMLSQDGARRLLGYKVSMSDTWGALFEGNVFQSPARICRSTLFEPLIETEAVLHIDRPVHSDMTIDQILDACRVSAGIEVADSRFEGWFPGMPERLIMPRPADTEADNAFASSVVIDSTKVPATSLPLGETRMIARRDGEVIAQGRLDYVMGHPANTVLWLARELEDAGSKLEVGQFVFTGNPYPEFVTIKAHEQANFDAVLEGVGAATLQIY